MDSVTHTVLGACIGQALAGKKIGKKAMLWGALSNNLPDIDVFTSMWMSQAEGLLAHRGFTHSFLFALLISPLLAFLFHRWHKKSTMLYREWLWIFLSGNLIHIAIDSLTCYGTGWFEPFSHARVAFNVLFVADIFYTLPILVAFFVLLVTSRKNKNRMMWSRAGIFISTAYILYAIINKVTIDRHFTRELNRQQLDHHRIYSNPTPLNNWLWYLAAQNDSGYYIGYRSLFDDTDSIAFAYVPMNRHLLDSIQTDPDVERLKRFSQGLYAVSAADDTLYFSDIRFGQVGGWNDAHLPFVFRYVLGKGANNDLVIQRGRLAASRSDMIGSLVERIKGK
jgi:inner membrane protein